MIPKELTLETDRVLLRPMAEQDFGDFFALAQDEDAWRFFTFNLSDRQGLQTWMNMAFHDLDAGNRRPFTVIDKKSGKIAGSTSMGNISQHDLRLEIGWSWLGSNYRGSGINRHAKYAQLKYIFDSIYFERVEFKTDVLNQRSRRALAGIGAREEGILRNHMTMWNDRRRDSIYFSIIRPEWPLLKQSIFKDLESHEAH